MIGVKVSLEEVQKLLDEKNLEWIDKVYKNNKTPLNCRCKICKNKCSPTYKDLTKTFGGCAVCSGFSKPNVETIESLLAENSLEWINKVYKNNKTPLNCRCKICKNECHPSFNNLQRGQGGCLICGSVSTIRNGRLSIVLFHWKTGSEVICVGSYEKSVIEYLNKNQINYEWHQDDFITNILKKNKKDFRIYTPDLYLPDQNLWVEIKGFFRTELNKQKWLWFHENYPNSELWTKDVLVQKGIL